jgi:hypothetical protein
MASNFLFIACFYKTLTLDTRALPFLLRMLDEMSENLGNPTPWRPGVMRMFQTCVMMAAMADCFESFEQAIHVGLCKLGKSYKMKNQTFRTT